MPEILAHELCLDYRLAIDSEASYLNAVVRAVFLDASAVVLPRLGKDVTNDPLYATRNGQYSAYLAALLKEDTRFMATRGVLYNMNIIAGRCGDESVSRNIHAIVDALRGRMAESSMPCHDIKSSMEDIRKRSIQKVRDSNRKGCYNLSETNILFISYATAFAELYNQGIVCLSNDRSLLKAGAHIADSGRLPVAYLTMLDTGDAYRFRWWKHGRKSCAACSASRQ